MKAKSLIIIVLSVIFFISKAQAQQWKLYKEVDGVKIFYSYQDCHDEKQSFHRQFVVLRFENTTDKTLQVTWKVNTWYNQKCSGCDSNSPEFERLISLEPKQTKEGDCNFNSSKLLRIFSKFLNYEDKTSELEKFELVNIKVSTIKREGIQ